jgi:predicted NAD/FAD-binding protein
MSSKPTLAVVGSGISGLFSAYFLSQHYQVTLFEQNNYYGGHSNTVNINYNGLNIDVDTGFIVFNEKTYPNFLQFLALLDVAYEPSKMSFAVQILNQQKILLEYAGTNFAGLFAHKKNFFNYRFLKMLIEIVRFNKVALQVLQNETDFSYSLANFLQDQKFSSYFCKHYLFPMASAIWSTDINEIGNYPAISFVQFFYNHGLLTINNQPQWYTISGGSKKYVAKALDFIKQNGGLLYQQKVLTINSGNNQHLINTENSQYSFDKVVLACHANQALEITKNLSTQQIEVLKNFSYQKNTAVLHKDISVMPKSKKAWASWVYTSNIASSSKLSVSYWMNNLQNISNNHPLFVTLNPQQNIDQQNIFASITYHHPVFNQQALQAQQKIPQIQGQNNLYFCGAYQRYGFHEDGVFSALQLVNSLGIYTPWQNSAV